MLLLQNLFYAQRLPESCKWLVSVAVGVEAGFLSFFNTTAEAAMTITATTMTMIRYSIGRSAVAGSDEGKGEIGGEFVGVGVGALDGEIRGVADGVGVGWGVPIVKLMVW